MGQFVTVQDAAHQLNISSDTIRRWDKKGLIKSTRDKRNFRLFSLEEIKRVSRKYLQNNEYNNYKIHVDPQQTDYKVIELFAGAGGLALGLQNAGLQTELLVEIDKNCCDTLRANFPSKNILCSDVTQINFESYRHKIDVVTGGFPCQAFSYAGKSLGFQDIRGTLFFEFARCVNEVKPKIILGENVKGLLGHDEGRTLKTMINVLADIGYKVAYKIVRCQFLDVPQKRERLIIFGIRNDIQTPYFFPKEKDYTISLREAFTNCPESEGAKYPPKKYDVLKLVPQGGYWRDLPEDIQKSYMAGSYHLGGGKTGMARRLSLDEPSLTLTCSPAQKQTERCHPTETRPLNIREYARIQTFPDNWNFTGSVASQYKQIGNAVPVNLGFYLGKSLIAMLDNRFYDEKVMEEG